MAQTTKGQDKADDLIKGMILGAEKACKEYLKLSGHPSPGVSPELFLQAGAARSLLKFKSTWTVLEAPVCETLKDAGAKATGPQKKSMRANGRYDIVLYRKNNSPRAAIEVKSPVNVNAKQRYEKDMDRLINTMTRNRDATFQFTSFLFLTVKRKNKIDYDFNQASSEIEHFVSNVLKKVANEKIKDPKNLKLKLKLQVNSSRTYKIPGDKHGAWRISAISFMR